MTREEAIEFGNMWLEVNEDCKDSSTYVFFQMATKALKQEPKTGHWIDADGDNAICGCCNRLNHLYGDYCKHCGAKMVESQESELDGNPVDIDKAVEHYEGTLEALKDIDLEVDR